MNEQNPTWHWRRANVATWQAEIDGVRYTINEYDPAQWEAHSYAAATDYDDGPKQIGGTYPKMLWAMEACQRQAGQPSARLTWDLEIDGLWGKMRPVTKQEFFQVIGPQNVHPRVDESSLSKRFHTSVFETRKRQPVGRSVSDGWDVLPTAFYLAAQ